MPIHVTRSKDSPRSAWCQRGWLRGRILRDHGHRACITRRISRSRGIRMTVVFLFATRVRSMCAIVPLRVCSRYFKMRGHLPDQSGRLIGIIFGNRSDVKTVLRPFREALP